LDFNQSKEKDEHDWFDPEFMLPVQHSPSKLESRSKVDFTSPDRNNRLVVVLPNSFSSYQEFAQKVHQIGLVDQREILYYAISTDDNELEMQRWLTTLVAITRSPLVRVQSRLVKIESWVEKLRDEVQPADLIICPYEYRLKSGFFQTVPLSQYLHDNVSSNVRVIPGAFQPHTRQITPWLRVAIFWIGCIVILFGFGILEINADGMLHGFIRPLILIMLLVIEMGVIWAWNSVIG
jgi:hypothetical protein